MRLTADGSRPAASAWAISRCKALPKAICLALNRLPIQTFNWQHNLSLLKKKTHFMGFLYWIQWLKRKRLCLLKSKLCNSKSGSNLNCVNPRRSSKFMIACTASSCQEWTSRRTALILMRSEKPSDDYLSIAMTACIFACLLTPQILR